jgi:putative endonuclease
VSRSKGKHWELVAERWLRRHDVKVIERNFNCRTGEIDLVVRDGSDIAFVEVKYRSRTGFGSGADHVTQTKQRRIVSAARRYVHYHRHAASQVFRFDVVSIRDAPGGVQIQWIKSAFEAV